MAELKIVKLDYVTEATCGIGAVTGQHLTSGEGRLTVYVYFGNLV